MLWRDCLEPTDKELEDRITFIENYKTIWRGNPGYVRLLEVELWALYFTLEHRHKREI